jgi:hypothetical protein
MSMRRAVLLPLALSAVPAAAQGRAVCAVEQAIPCPRFEECARNPPAAINLPALLRIDPVAKLIESRMNDGAARTSPISAVIEAGGSMLMQGADDDLPWSMTVDLAAGAFALVVADEQAGYVAFGVCSRAPSQ